MFGVLRQALGSPTSSSVPILPSPALLLVETALLDIQCTLHRLSEGLTGGQMGVGENETDRRGWFEPCQADPGTKGGLDLLALFRTPGRQGREPGRAGRRTVVMSRQPDYQ